MSLGQEGLRNRLWLNALGATGSTSGLADNSPVENGSRLLAYHLVTSKRLETDFGSASHFW